MGGAQMGGVVNGLGLGGPFSGRVGVHLGRIWVHLGRMWVMCPPGAPFWAVGSLLGSPPPKFRKPRRRVRRLRRRERLRADELLHSAPPLRHSDFGSRWGRPTP